MLETLRVMLLVVCLRSLTSPITASTCAWRQMHEEVTSVMYSLLVSDDALSLEQSLHSLHLCNSIELLTAVCRSQRFRVTT